MEASGVLLTLRRDSCLAIQLVASKRRRWWDGYEEHWRIEAACGCPGEFKDHELLPGKCGSAARIRQPTSGRRTRVGPLSIGYLPYSAPAGQIAHFGTLHPCLTNPEPSRHGVCGRSTPA